MNNPGGAGRDSGLDLVEGAAICTPDLNKPGTRGQVKVIVDKPMSPLDDQFVRHAIGDWQL